TPPKSTQDMARDLSSVGTLSAAANRYCWAKAAEVPKTASARQKSQKLLSQAAKAASRADGTATPAPNMKPCLRPQVWISQAAGPVASAVPMIMKLTGTVARLLSATIAAAVSAAMEMRIAWPAP